MRERLGWCLMADQDEPTTQKSEECLEEVILSTFLKYRNLLSRVDYIASIETEQLQYLFIWYEEQ